MTKIRIISWNINSVRARLDLVEKLIEKYQPHVLCLQETKVQDHMFPREFFNQLGFCHHAIAGQKSHHGVATLSRIPMTNIGPINWCDKGDARHIEIKLENNIKLHNFYVPAGGDEPDATINDKFAYKLDFLEEMTNWSAALSTDDKCILVGDLNIAPLQSDVWSHKKLGADPDNYSSFSLTHCFSSFN